MESEFNDNDEEELEVVEETTEDVEFFPSELSAVELIEEVHEDKGVEDHSVMFKFMDSVNC